MPSPLQPEIKVWPETKARQILVVEDDALVSEPIVAMLDGDYETVVAGTVEAGLAGLQGWGASAIENSGSPALLLLDCMLPGGGLLRLLRMADLQAIPVVLMSGDPQCAAQIDISRPFLPKPFSRATLLQVLIEAPPRSHGQSAGRPVDFLLIRTA